MIQLFVTNNVEYGFCDLYQSIFIVRFLANHLYQFSLNSNLNFLQSSEEDEEVKTEQKVSESTVLQEQLVGIINNILQEQDNFRARQVSVIRTKDSTKIFLRERNS